MIDIYLIDDVAEENQIVESIIKSNFRNIRTTSFEDSTVALEKILINKPQIIITDNGMPNLDGIGLIEKVYPVYRPFTVLVSAIDYFDKRFDYFIYKPIKPNQLITIIGILLNRNLSNEEIIKLLQEKIKGNVKDFLFIKKALYIKNELMYDENASETSILEILAEEFGISKSGAQKKLSRIGDKNRSIYGKVKPLEFLKIIYNTIFGD